MNAENSISRRDFVTGATAALAAAAAPAAEEKIGAKPSSPLAIDGGEKAVKASPAWTRRWGKPELQQLEAMLQQDSLFWWKGPQAKLFTERFQEVCPLKYVHVCSSGTAAIHIAVAAAGIAPGDEVITTPLTDMGTVIGVLFQQAVPVFADVEPNTGNLSVADVERRITPKTKAIIAVHLLGNPCDIDGLKALADRHRLVLIEDCAQAWGARTKGRPIGTIGHIACFSLQDSKHVTCGDGGVVASNDERYGPLLRGYGDKGFNRVTGRHFEVFATNYRMSEPQAAVAAAQLTRLEGIAARRARLGALLTERIAKIPGIQAHHVRPEDRCVYWHHMFRLASGAFRCDRSRFVKALLAEGAPASTGIMFGPLYQTPVFQSHGFFAGRWPVRELGLTTIDYTKHRCPEAEAIHQTCVRLPLDQRMSEDYILQLGAAIEKVARHFAA